MKAIDIFSVILGFFISLILFSLLIFTYIEFGAEYFDGIDNRSNMSQLDLQKLSRKIKVIDTHLDQFYLYESEAIDEDIIINAYMDSKMDKYSCYFSKDEYETIIESSLGIFQGIGIVVGVVEERVYVTDVIKDSNAYKVGITAGDLIISIDGIVPMNQNINELFDGSSDVIQMEILQNGISNIFNFNINERMRISSVYATLINNDTGYIRIDAFNKNTHNEFKNEYEKVNSVKTIVVDLRDNYGGDVESAVQIIERFVPKGNLLITTENRDLQPKKYVSTTDDVYFNHIMYILVNENTASAAEIFAGVLQYYGKAILVGEETYGKGVIQSVYSLYDDSAIKLTTARYFFPSGKSLGDAGLKPDIHLTFSKQHEDTNVMKTILFMIEEEEI